MTTIPSATKVEGLSGERFQVIYHVVADDHADAQKRAQSIAVEQTIEFPAELVPPGDIADQIIGQVERIAGLPDGRFEVVVSYANETAGPGIVQFLNVIYGNISLLPGIRLERLDLPTSKLVDFVGPRFGRQGVRERVGVQGRPLMCSALKPMGLSPEALAEMAYRFALGGLDLIKDDHGLINQPFSTFRERVERCGEAVQRANQETGLNCLYFPNVTAASDRVQAYAQFAADHGAGGLLICPAITGLDAMRRLAVDGIDLPVMSHPSFSGSLVTSPHNGISHYAYYGQIQRLAGADMSVYPNFGGRFSFTPEQCRTIVEGTQAKMGHIKDAFPAPGGGMTMDKVATMNAFYGQEVVYLVGGGLHRHSDDLTENVRYFMRLITGGEAA